MTRELMPNQDEDIAEPTLDTDPEEITSDPLLNDEQMTVEEAAAYVGVNENEFEALAKRAGIGRHYDPRETGQFVWARSDVDQVKKQREAA